MPRPKKKLLDGPQMLNTGPGQEFWQNRLNQIQRLRSRPEPPFVVRRVLDDPRPVDPPAAPVPRQEIPPQVRLRTREGVRMPTTRRPQLDIPDEYVPNNPTDIPRFEPTPPIRPRQPAPTYFPRGRGVPKGNILDELPINNMNVPRESPPTSEFPFTNQPEPPSEFRMPFNEPVPVARPPTIPRMPFNEPVPVARPPTIPRLPVQAPAPFQRPIVPEYEPDFEPNLNYPEWTEPIQEIAFNAGRSASTAGRALTTAAEAAGVAAGETLTGIGGAIGLEGGMAMLAGGGIVGAGVLAAGLLGYGVYLLGKRLHDKFKAAHDKHGQEAALAALARQAETDRILNRKLEKHLAPEDMQVLKDHIPLHTEVDLVPTKRKKPEQAEQKDEQQIQPQKEEKRVFADDSSSTIHNTHKESTQINPAPKINTPSSQPSTISTPTEDKQMFQPPEPEKPIDTTERDRHIYNPDRPQQPKQSFQDSSNNSIRPLNNQQQPRLSAEQYQYIRQRDPGYMV